MHRIVRQTSLGVRAMLVSAALLLAILPRLAQAGLFDRLTPAPAEADTLPAAGASPSAAIATSSSSSSAALVCLNGGVLLRTVDPLDTHQTDVQCACAAGWLGVDCGFRDWCAQSPCLNDGACFNTFQGPLCHCTPQFAGGTCAQPNPCAEQDCSGHGTCLLREIVPPSAKAETEQPTPAADKRPATPAAAAADRRRRRRPATAAESGDSSAEAEHLRNASVAHALNSRVVGDCRCEVGWTGPTCAIKHADACAAIEPCTVFNSARDYTGESLCGCERAIAERCTWCLEQGVAFAADSALPGATKCLAPLDVAAQCPPASAQAIPKCTLMDGTPFGWCVVNAAQSLGFAVDGNPTAPTVGTQHCHQWVWNRDGCKPEWSTRDPSRDKEAATASAIAVAHPTAEQCLAVPACSDAETAGSSLCGCQAALSIGCHWCLEQQLAFPSGSTEDRRGCRSRATTVSQCPSQQAQTIHQCVGVGGTPYGWCSIDSAEPSMGYSMDGTAASPASPHKCLKWFWFSNACPGFSVMPLAAAAELVDTAAAASVALTSTQLGEKEASGEGGPASEPSGAPMTEKQERAAVTPPKQLNRSVRLYLLIWLCLLVLALLIRWLPHWLEKSDYHPIRDRAATEAQ